MSAWAQTEIKTSMRKTAQLETRLRVTAAKHQTTQQATPENTKTAAQPQRTHKLATAQLKQAPGQAQSYVVKQDRAANPTANKSNTTGPSAKLKQYCVSADSRHKLVHGACMAGSAGQGLATWVPPGNCACMDMHTVHARGTTAATLCPQTRCWRQGHARACQARARMERRPAA